jgi:hypothetical protein
MGLFNIFKRGEQPKNPTTDNGVLGPAFLEGFTEHIENPKNLLPHEWRRQLKTPDGQTKFRIKFYGECKGLIMQTDFAPPIIYAVESSTDQEILLFDGCKHGYNALFCDKFTDEQIKNRPVTNFYKDADGNELFEIIISTFNGIDYEEEFADQVDENGLIEIIDGSKIEFDKVKSNGFDTIQIWAINETGKMMEILSEECS